MYDASKGMMPGKHMCLMLRYCTNSNVTAVHCCTGQAQALWVAEGPHVPAAWERSQRCVFAP